MTWFQLYYQQDLVRLIQTWNHANFFSICVSFCCFFFSSCIITVVFRVISSCGTFLVLVSGKAFFLSAVESKCKLQYFKKLKYMYSMIAIRILCKENYDSFVTGK